MVYRFCVAKVPYCLFGVDHFDAIQCIGPMVFSMLPNEGSVKDIMQNDPNMGSHSLRQLAVWAHNLLGSRSLRPLAAGPN